MTSFPSLSKRENNTILVYTYADKSSVANNCNKGEDKKEEEEKEKEALKY